MASVAVVETRRRQTERTGLSWDRDIQGHHSMLTKIGLACRTKGDNWNIPFLETAQESVQLRRLAGIGDSKHHIGGGDHTEIAMHSLNRMKKNGRCACRIQGCRNFLPDQSRFSDSGHHKSTRAGHDNINSLLKFLAQIIANRENPFGFNRQAPLWPMQYSRCFPPYQQHIVPCFVQPA